MQRSSDRLCVKNSFEATVGMQSFAACSTSPHRGKVGAQRSASGERGDPEQRILA
jgi:hypothetical protein